MNESVPNQRNDGPAGAFNDYAIPAPATALVGRPDEQLLPRNVARHVQIDGLRALAMISVLYIHFWHRDPIAENLRVSLFFVVSGFLITHILYTAKEHGGQIHVFNFYIRRMLRLFPALGILIITAFAFDMDGFRQSVWWHLLQLSNVKFAISEEITPWITGHLWSLNVLEQFYLIYPIVILLLPLRKIFSVVMGIAVASVVLRNHGDLLGIQGWFRYMVFAADPIAAGAFFYLLQREPKIRRYMRSWSALGVSLLFLISPYLIGQGFGGTETYRLLSQPALAAIVVGAFHGYQGPVGFALGCKVARFTSKLSYGIYIYHLPIWWLTAEVYPPILNLGPVAFLVVSSLTCAVAAMSWHVLEEPIARLKSRFPTATRLV